MVTCKWVTNDTRFALRALSSTVCNHEFLELSRPSFGRHRARAARCDHHYLYDFARRARGPCRGGVRGTRARRSNQSVLRAIWIGQTAPRTIFDLHGRALARRFGDEHSLAAPGAPGPRRIFPRDIGAVHFRFADFDFDWYS